MQCEDLAPRLAASLEDPTALRRRDHDHLAHCLRCQAEVARGRRLRRQVAGLRDVVLVPPDDLLEQIYDALDEADGRVGRHRRVAWVSGIAAATAAAAGGAIVLVTRTGRSRRHRLPLAG